MKKNYLFLTLLGTSILASGQAGAMNLAQTLGENSSFQKPIFHEITRGETGYSFNHSPDVTEKNKKELADDWAQVEALRKKQLDILAKINELQKSVSQSANQLEQTNQPEGIINSFKKLTEASFFQMRKEINQDLSEQKGAVEGLKTILVKKYGVKTAREIINDLNQGRNSLKAIMSGVNEDAPKTLTAVTKNALDRGYQIIQQEREEEEKLYTRELEQRSKEREDVATQIKEKTREKDELDKRNFENHQKKERINELKEKQKRLKDGDIRLEKQIENDKEYLLSLGKQNIELEDNLNNLRQPLNLDIIKEKKEEIPGTSEANDTSVISIPYSHKSQEWEEVKNVASVNGNILSQALGDKNATKEFYQEKLKAIESELDEKRQELQALEDDLAQRVPETEVQEDEVLKEATGLDQVANEVSLKQRRLEQLEREIQNAEGYQNFLIQEIQRLKQEESENNSLGGNQDPNEQNQKKELTEEECVKIKGQFNVLGQELEKNLNILGMDLAGISADTLAAIENHLNGKLKDGKGFIENLTQVAVYGADMERYGSLKQKYNEEATKDLEIINAIWGQKEKAILPIKTILSADSIEKWSKDSLSQVPVLGTKVVEYLTALITILQNEEKPQEEKPQLDQKIIDLTVGNFLEKFQSDQEKYEEILRLAKEVHVKVYGNAHEIDLPWQFRNPTHKDSLLSKIKDLPQSNQTTAQEALNALQQAVEETAIEVAEDDYIGMSLDKSQTKSNLVESFQNAFKKQDVQNAAKAAIKEIEQKSVEDNTRIEQKFFRTKQVERILHVLNQNLTEKEIEKNIKILLTKIKNRTEQLPATTEFVLIAGYNYPSIMAKYSPLVEKILGSEHTGKDANQLKDLIKQELVKRGYETTGKAPKLTFSKKQ